MKGFTFATFGIDFRAATTAGSPAFAFTVLNMSISSDNSPLGALGATGLSSEVQAVNVMLPIKAAMTNKLNFLILNYYLTGY